MDLYKKLVNKEETLAVIGIGYVGMPLAVAFAKKINVIGFDTNESKVNEYNRGNDITNEVGDKALLESTAIFTSDERELNNAKFFVVAVPTPVKNDNTPDLTPIIGASEIIGKNLTKGSIVVYESTVYPGVTEEICVPILEEKSGLICGRDFKVGYSPERINPGDKVNTIEKIIKIVSGMDSKSLEIIAKTYELIIEAGVYRAESIKVAEAAKVIENSQRDINIAFVNELSIIFNSMGIDTRAVLEAASTKWNFIKMNPGLVGGHCIGVDPYYLIYKAANLGIKSKVISAGREINDGMAKFVVENLVKSLIRNDKLVKGANIGVLGLTFKEDCPDVRNSKIMDIILELKGYDINVVAVDPIADAGDLKNIYNIEKVDYAKIENLDAVIVAVSHTMFRELGMEDIKTLYKKNTKHILFDLKGIYDKDKFIDNGFEYWRL